MRALVSLEISGRIGVVRIDTPESSVLSQPVRAGLVEALALAEKADGIGAVALLCEGNCFIAGTAGPDAPAQAPTLPTLLAAIGGCAKPVVCAIQGEARGGGLETALACHYRIAERGTRFVLPRPRAGARPAPPDGLRAALDAGLAGRTLDADQAQAAGMLHLVVDEDAHTTALAIAQSLAVRHLPNARTQARPDFAPGWPGTAFSPAPATRAGIRQG